MAGLRIIIEAIILDIAICEYPKEAQFLTEI